MSAPLKIHTSSRKYRRFVSTWPGVELVPADEAAFSLDFRIDCGCELKISASFGHAKLTVGQGGCTYVSGGVKEFESQNTEEMEEAIANLGQLLRVLAKIPPPRPQKGKILSWRDAL